MRLETLLTGLSSAILALIGYYIYEWINRRWFKRKEFLKIANSLQFPEQVSILLWDKSKGRIRQLLTQDKKEEQKFAAGFEIFKPQESMLEEIRSGLPAGYYAYITDFDQKSKRIGIIKGKDQFAILKTMHTQGDEYKVSNARLINELKILDKKYPFRIEGAGYEWVELYLETLPDNLGDLISKVKELCPMLVDPEAELQMTQKLFLWWPIQEQGLAQAHE